MDDRTALINSRPDAFLQQAEKIQRELYETLVDYFAGIKTTNGKIDNVPANIQMAARARDDIRKWLRQYGYFDAVKEYSIGLDELAGLGREFYAAMDLKSTFTARDFEVLSTFKSDHINFIRGADITVQNMVYDSLVSSIYSGGTFRELRTNLANVVLDNTAGNGALKKYLGTRAFDAFAGFDREIQNIKSAELELDLFLYSGNAIKDTRVFCMDRVGKIFTTAEINSWQKLKWVGKNPTVSVWLALGGYNCRHILSPVTKEFAESFRK